jgi:hypothetical protein
MHRLLIAAAAAAALATAAQAQPPGGRRGGQPPNLDTNRDGKVTLAEFKAGQAERNNRMFARMDANKDGKITSAEMAAAAKRAQAEGRGPPPGAPQGGGPGGFLMRMDANKDGAVTKAEMAAQGQRRFEMADTNHDGWLSRGEILMMRQGRGGPGDA